MLERTRSATEEAKSQPFHPASTPISREDIFPPTVPDTRRTHYTSEGPGNDRASNQELVSEPEVPEKTSRKRGRQTGKTGFFNVREE